MFWFGAEYARWLIMVSPSPKPMVEFRDWGTVRGALHTKMSNKECITSTVRYL
jgi:hypothetical protein